MKYCMICEQKYGDDGFIFCPMCAAALILVVKLESGLYQLGDLISEE